MRILDSNLVIYATQTAYAHLRPLLHAPDCFVSAITKLEVLGYHRLGEQERDNLSELFQTLQIIPIDSAIIEQAITLRQIRKMSVGDAIIAATAILYHCELLTRNISDFQIQGLTVSNPI